MEYCSVIRRNELLKHAPTSVNLKHIRVSERTRKKTAVSVMFRKTRGMANESVVSRGWRRCNELKSTGVYFCGNGTIPRLKYVVSIDRIHLSQKSQNDQPGE